VVIFGTYLRSYLLPVLVPAAIGAAALFGRPRGLAAGVAMIFVAFVAGDAMLTVDGEKRGNRQEFFSIARSIDPRGCLYVYSGEPAFYRVTDACIPTRFAFPSHLSRLGEAGAIGTDAVAEIGRIMRTQPATVMMSTPYNDENWRARRTVTDALSASYVRVLHAKLGDNDVNVFHLRVGLPTGHRP
jgi:hypothetical protein